VFLSPLQFNIFKKYSYTQAEISGAGTAFQAPKIAMQFNLGGPVVEGNIYQACTGLMRDLNIY
jgi:hypothetical protein